VTTLTSAILTGTVCDQYLSRSSFVTAVVRFEAALARAQAALGVIPADAADAIEAAARGFSPDLGTIAAKGHDAGTPVVEILVQLGEAVERQREGAGRFMHAGATSQDALDTAMVLCVKPCVQLALEALGASRRAAFDLARKHADSPVLARTLMQAAGVTTFGATAANWGLALGRCEKRLREAAEEGLHVQLGGPVSTGASFGDRWPELRNAVARELGLAAGPAGTWQSARDAWTNLSMQLGLATGIAAKIAGDLALMSQTEVGEVRDPSSEGGLSSAMPHKRNPVLCMRIRSCAHNVQGLTGSLLSTIAVEQERGLGTWQAELAIAPPLVSYAASALGSLASLLCGLYFDRERAERNIDAARKLYGAGFDERASVEAARRAAEQMLKEEKG
jgi:3-carboxy-cis,cis-muconate cycloisomerase